MKYLIILSLFLAQTIIPTNTEENVKWHYDYEKAVKVAKKSNKNVLLYFTGSDWCSPCKMLKKDLFSTSEFENLSKEYTLLYVDIPRNQDLLTAKQYQENKAVMAQWNKKGVFPLFVVLNSKEKEIGRHSGYGMNGDVSYHLKFLKKNQ